MIKPRTAPDLAYCIKCHKVLGDHKGWFGPQCMCDRRQTRRAAKPGHPWGPPPT